MTDPKRKFWGWGLAAEGPDEAQTRKLGAGLAARFGQDASEVTPAPRLEELDLRAPRVRPPAALEACVTDAPFERARHSYGASYSDVIRALRREYPEPPDQVAFPRSDAEVERVLEWCSAERIAAIPYGGGSSVVGGVECAVGGDYQGVVSVDLGGFGRVLEIDRTSRTAQILSLRDI